MAINCEWIRYGDQLGYLAYPERAAGTRLGRSEAMNLATTVLALSNDFGIEGMIDPEASPPRLFGELLSRIIDGSSFARFEAESATTAERLSRKPGRRKP